MYPLCVSIYCDCYFVLIFYPASSLIDVEQIVFLIFWTVIFHCYVFSFTYSEARSSIWSGSFNVYSAHWILRIISYHIWKLISFLCYFLKSGKKTKYSKFSSRVFARPRLQFPIWITIWNCGCLAKP